MEQSILLYLLDILSDAKVLSDDDKTSFSKAYRIGLPTSYAFNFLKDVMIDMVSVNNLKRRLDRFICSY